MKIDEIVDMVEKKIADKYREPILEQLNGIAAKAPQGAADQLNCWMMGALSGWNMAASLAEQLRRATPWRQKYDLVDEQRIRWLTNLAAVLGVEARMVPFALPEVAFEMLLQHLRAQQRALSDAVKEAEMHRHLGDDLRAKLPP